jgi:hypothetical protein
MAAYALLAVMCGFLGIGIPRMAAELVGGALGHAIEDLACCRLHGAHVWSASGWSGWCNRTRWGASAVAGGAAAQWQRTHSSEPAMQSFAANVAAEARARNAAEPTKPLNPFNGQQPGYNMRPPAGPSLPPSNGSGSGGAALEYQPGKPGAKTKAEAIDITKLQRG